MVKKPLKAYHCRTDWGEDHEIYFASRNIEARRWFASEHCEGQLGGISCTRIPWADEHAPGPVSAKILIDNGWWFECFHCSEMVNSDNQEPVYHGLYDVFCDQKCADEWRGEKRRSKIIERYALKAFTENLQHRLSIQHPLITHRHVFVSRKKETGRLGVHQIIISFKFPGQKYSDAEFRLDDRHGKPNFTCSHGDKEAFKSWLNKCARMGSATDPAI